MQSSQFRPKKLLPRCGKAQKADADAVVVADEDVATIDGAAAGAVAARRLKAKVKVMATVLYSS